MLSLSAVVDIYLGANSELKFHDSINFSTFSETTSPLNVPPLTDIVIHNAGSV
jgi:hypothetical protein